MLKFSLWVASALAVLIASAAGQRRINDNHNQLTTPIKISPANLRSTTFYLGLTEDHEAFWNRFEENKPSVEFRLAQLARVGCNGVRLWGSYRAFLRSEFVEAPQQNNYWKRVAWFLDRADDLEIAGTIVLFNAANYGGGAGESWTTTDPGSSTNSVVALDSSHVQLDLVPNIVDDPAGGNGGGFDRCVLWVGHPDQFSQGLKSDRAFLFRHKTTFLGDTNPAVIGFVKDYVARMSNAAAGNVTQKPALQTLEIFNEPITLGDMRPALHPRGFAPPDESWGDVCYRIFNLNGVFRTIATKSLADFA